MSRRSQGLQSGRKVNTPKNSLLSSKPLWNYYKIDESQWMKHIKPSLTGRLLTEWEATPRQDKGN